MLNGEAGKGDTYRPVDYRMWSKNWDAVFGKKKPKHPKSKVRMTNVNHSRKENSNG